jgi:aerobic carbon-monoxide dehydrogenase medium subunit
MASLSINQQISYVAPASLQEAIALITRNPLAQILAGGHSLLAAIKLDKVRPSLLVDLAQIPGLEGVEWLPGEAMAEPSKGIALKVGAMVSYRQIAEDEKIQTAYPALAEAVAAIGDVQIRNWGRIGDVFAYRHLACDLLAAALALEAVFVVQTLAGSQRQSAMAFASNLLASDLADSDSRYLVSALEFPATSMSTGYAFFKHAASGCTLCGCAVAIQVGANDAIEQCRVALSGSAVAAMRLSAVEAFLIGTLPTIEDLAAVSQQVSNLVLSTFENIHESAYEGVAADYVAHLSGVAVSRALTRALTTALHQAS